MLRSPSVRLAFAALLLAAAPAGGAPCDGTGTSIVVETEARRLWLCQAGAAAAGYAVSLGRGGNGKTDEGDGKTPLGDYALGAPRASKEFGRFIPIAYPTAAQ